MLGATYSTRPIVSLFRTLGGRWAQRGPTSWSHNGKTVSVSVLRLDHVQLAMPAGCEADAVAFYDGLLGIPEVVKPPNLAARGGCWFERGDLKVHLGVDRDFRPATKAHPALLVDNVRELARAIGAAGFQVVDDEPLAGYERVYVDDPFGNRIELMEPLYS